MSEEEMQESDFEESEIRTGLAIMEGESYQYLKLFYKTTKKEGASTLTIANINKREHQVFFGWDLVSVGLRKLGLNDLADVNDREKEAYFLSTISIGARGRDDNRIILGRSQSTQKKGKKLGIF